MPASLKRGRGLGSRRGGEGRAPVAPGTHPGNSLSKSKFFLSFLQTRTPSFLCQMILVRNLCTQHSENARPHDKTVFLGHHSPAGEKAPNIGFFFFIPVLYVVECSEQTPNSAVPRGARHRGALHSVWFTWWARCPCTFCSALTTTTKS